MKYNTRVNLAARFADKINAIEKSCYAEMLYRSYNPEYSTAEIDPFPEAVPVASAELESEEIACVSSDTIRENMEAEKILYNKVVPS
jgi:hypothetical protein